MSASGYQAVLLFQEKYASVLLSAAQPHPLVYEPYHALVRESAVRRLNLLCQKILAEVVHNSVRSYRTPDPLSIDY